MSKTKTDAAVEPGAMTTKDILRMAALAEIQPAPFNPRQIRNPKADAELLASVKEGGVRENLLVRPVNSHLELVCGTRRFEAATKAGLAEVPVLIRELDDAQVLQEQAIENSQREDVHPLEEAECYRRVRQVNARRASMHAVKRDPFPAVKFDEDLERRREEQRWN